MARGRWITPEETGDSNIARCLSVPEKLQPAVNWALEQMTFAENWEQVGALTPQECADAMTDVLSTYYESVCDVPQIFPEYYWFTQANFTVINGAGLSISLASNQILDGNWQ